MARKTQTLELHEVGGDHYPDQATAQKDAITFIARSLVYSMRSMLADGLLVIVNGKIIPNLERNNQ